MYTQCPHCQTCFRITEAHLKAAKGKVRCGSCQEVFDATGHLYTKLPPVEENMIPPAEKISIRPQDLSRLDHEHIDLSAPPEKKEEKPSNIQTKQPDQSKFMESTIGTNARYNNLDDMGPVHVPGELALDDSFIKFGKPEKQPPEKQQAEPENPYEDIESKEAPTTDDDVEQIQNLYSAADELLHSNPDEESNQDDIDKHIDELLAFTRGLDKTSDQPQESAKQNQDDMDSMDDIEILPVAPASTDSLEEAAENSKKTVSEKHQNRSIDFDAINLGMEPLTGEQSTLSDTTLGVKDPEPHFAFQRQPESETDQASNAKEQNRTEPDDLDDFFDDSETRNTTIPDDDLPSLEQDIPPALRRSLEKSEAPVRSPWVTAGLSFAILVLVVGLLLQMVIFRSTELARMSPALQPLLTNLCATLPCTYSGPVDVSKISLTNRDVRSHPTQKNALLISAAFVNQATFDQPYPDILVTLSDLSGNIVANRRFTPQEYLDKMYSRFLLMESGTPVHITLPVLDPGDDAINFEFTFL